MTLILFAAVCVFLLMLFSLRERVSNLEWRIEKLDAEKLRSGRQPSVNADANSQVQSPTQLVTPSQPTPAAPSVPQAPSIFSPQSVAHSTPAVSQRMQIPVASPAYSTEPSFDFIAWIKDGFLVKIGAALFFFGAALFMSYAFANDWVSPVMRIVIGFAIAGGVYGLSVWRMNLSVQQGLVLNALGTGVVLATVFAAQFVYSLFNEFFAIGLMVLAISFSVFTSLRSESERLSVAAAAAGLAVPFIAGVPDLSVVGHLVYLLVLTASFIWVVYKTGWTRIILLLLLGVEFFLFVLQSGAEANDKRIILLFAGVFALVFYGGGLLSNLVRRVVATPDLLIVGANALTLLYWIETLVPDSIQAIVAFLIATVAVVTAYALVTAGRDVSLGYTHAGIGLLFIFVATGYLFTGFVLTVVLAAEVAFLVGSAVWLEFKDVIVYWLSWLWVLPVVSSLSSIDSSAWQSGWLHTDMLALTTVAVGGILVAVLAYQKSYDVVCSVHSVLGGVYVIVATMLAVVAAVPESIEGPTLALVLALESMLAIVVTLRNRVPKATQYFAVGTFVLPALLSFSALDGGGWESGWLHAHAVSLYVLFGCSAAVSVVAHITKRALVKDVFFSLAWWFAVVIPWYTAMAVLSVETARHVLTIIYTLYSAAFLIIAIERRSRQSFLLRAALSTLLPAFLSLFVLSAPSWEYGIIHSAFLALLVLSAFSVSVCIWCGIEAKLHSQGVLLGRMCAVFAWAAGIYSVSLVWLTAHALVSNESTAVSVSLFVYVITGLTLYILGRAKGNRMLRLAGIITLVGVIARLVLVDVWSMEIAWRVLTFAGIGILFLSTSFIETSLKASGSFTDEPE